MKFSKNDRIDRQLYVMYIYSLTHAH